MRLPPRLLASFKEAWRKDFSTEISDELANEYGLSLLDHVMTLAGHPAALALAQKFESRPVSKKKPRKANEADGSTEPNNAKPTRV